MLIEYQNEFLSEGGKLYDPLKECLDHTNMIENSAKLTKSLREKGVSIFHVPIMFREVRILFFNVYLKSTISLLVFSPIYSLFLLT